MTMPEFEQFPKLPRYSRDVIVTEKIDGTNAQIFIPEDITAPVWAGSRNRWVTLDNDNYGFARWVHDHADELRNGLGPGRHYGEWWGQGIQRGYGLTEKRFSLFNTTRWGDAPPACCHVVPVLWTGSMDTLRPAEILEALEDLGSQAAPGFMRPEGIVIFHTAGNFGLKKTFAGDTKGKWEVPQ